jgi:hypothetical protein
MSNAKQSATKQTGGAGHARARSQQDGTGDGSGLEAPSGADPKRFGELLRRRAVSVIGTYIYGYDTWTPAGRARSLAQAFLGLAALFDSCPAGPVGAAIVAELAERTHVDDAWHALNGLVGLKAQRILLIRLVEGAADATKPRRIDRGRRTIMKHFLAGWLPLPLSPVQAIEGVRGGYATSFPETSRLDDAKIEAAIRAWDTPRGRPKKGAATGSKWAAISDLMESAGLPPSDPENVRREWLRYLSERRRLWKEHKAALVSPSSGASIVPMQVLKKTRVSRGKKPAGS